MTEVSGKKEEIARKILQLSRSQLIVHFRFLDRTITHLSFSQAEGLSLAVDGEKIFYGVDYVLYRYQQEKNRITRDLLHMMLHCVFQHWVIGKNIDRDRWDLACDIAVEHMITELHAPILYSEREELQRSMTALLKDEITLLSAEKIYRWLLDQELSPEEMQRAREAFAADGHGIWYGNFSKDAKTNHQVDLKKIWEDVSRRMQTELETIGEDQDTAIVRSLQRLNKKKHDYAKFLRSFGVHGETMKISEEEFDQNFYTYGMELYQNISLIEPLEYSETRRIRDFVIAIDTSGSVEGEKVQNFIQHTYDILHAEDTFFSRVNIRILQCDDRIREDVRISSKEEFETYIRTMELKGFGKTDFRPVFSYVGKLIENREFTRLQGLIYFTDGDGYYPEKRPGFDTAFILHGEDAAEEKVPSWAVSLILEEEELRL